MKLLQFTMVALMALTASARDIWTGSKYILNGRKVVIKKTLTLQNSPPL